MLGIRRVGAVRVEGVRFAVWGFGVRIEGLGTGFGVRFCVRG